MSISDFILNLFLLYAVVSQCQADLRNCGGREEYDDVHQICCNEKVKQRVDNQECCGRKEIYYPATKICCGNEVHPRFLPPQHNSNVTCDTNPHERCVEQTCCGNQLISERDTHCCFENPVPLNADQMNSIDFLECCKGTTIANTFISEFCCGGIAYNRKDDVECCYDEDTPAGHKCEQEKITCGGKSYDWNKDKCCNNVLHTNALSGYHSDEHQDCCGTFLYDTRKDLCCTVLDNQRQDYLIPKDTKIRCCGDSFYNTSREFCVNGEPKRKDPDHDLCGDHIYRPTEVTACCVHLLYNKTIEKCCKGLYTSVIPKTQKCCSGIGINNSQMCCFDVVPVSKKNAKDNQCCYSMKEDVYMTYFDQTSSCNSEGQVVVVPPGDKLCGDATTYDPDIEICCISTVANKADGFNSCCRGKPFNNKTHLCCGNSISDVSQGNCCKYDQKVYGHDDTSNPCKRECPGTNRYYDVYTERCCGKVHMPLHRHLDCCGNEIINNTVSECCAGNPIRIGSKFKCCGHSKINTEKKQCCASRFPLKKSGQWSCCDELQPYRSQYNDCDDGKLSPKGSKKDLSGIQLACHKDMWTRGDMLVQNACESGYAFKGKLSGIYFSQSKDEYTVRLWLSSINQLRKNKGFSVKNRKTQEEQIDITIIMSIRKPSRVICRKRFFKRFKNNEILVFLRKRPSNNKVNITETDFIYLTKNSTKKEKTLHEISKTFCRFLP